jgi:nitroreductase
MLAKAPLGIVVMADKTKSDVWVVDATIAAIIMQLEAHDLGLDSCWVNVHDRQKDDQTSSEDYIRQLFDIPEQYGILCVLSIGYKAEERKPHNVDELQYDKVHYGKF